MIWGFFLFIARRLKAVVSKLSRSHFQEAKHQVRRVPIRGVNSHVIMKEIERQQLSVDLRSGDAPWSLFT